MAVIGRYTFQQYLLLFGSEGIGVKETDAFGK